MSSPKRPVLAIIAILLSVLAYPLTPLPFLSIPRAQAASLTITLTGFVAAWNNTSNPNPAITSSQGDSITLTLINGDATTTFHRFFVDVDNNGPIPDCPAPDKCSLSFNTNTVYQFSVDFAPGAYTYYCSIHPTTMLGKFIVSPAPPAGGHHPLIK